eukprot:CAMPEP_0176490392 /NCGR_PEP_ID=MMETSP0200_2-20121128/7843_1 /TAXON_ID=947934 /ORGANISM="Chaetoceros sp., Strain GSL56" /LENGTH=205 /DNA_ID=CAMNT_0017887689 /DNA_START=11 /DNA_END=628 /DNA_ORIENTATION=+
MATETVSTSSSRSISTVKTKITPTRAPDAHRSRLLNRIGIFNAPNSVAPNPAIERKMKIIRAMGLGGPPKPQTHDSTSSIDTENIRPKIDFSKVTHEPLKYKAFEPAINKSSKVEVSAQKNKKDKKSKITFNDDVSVAHIPMRCEYSDRVRSRLWSNRYEIHENATRNAIEFQAEGWDWRSVTEDEGMFVCTSSGELIHPVHCQQ